jgi:hypothetical protein
MMSCDLKMGGFSQTSSRPPSLDPFPPRLCFLELAIEFSTTPSIEDSRFVIPSCLDGSHQGVSLARETTHNEYLLMHKFIPMWHGLGMVIHMMLKLAHEVLNYEKYPWLEPRNGIHFA